MGGQAATANRDRSALEFFSSSMANIDYGNCNCRNQAWAAQPGWRASFWYFLSSTGILSGWRKHDTYDASQHDEYYPPQAQDQGQCSWYWQKQQQEEELGLNDRPTNGEQHWLINEAYVCLPVPNITRDVVLCCLMTSLIGSRQGKRLSPMSSIWFRCVLHTPWFIPLPYHSILTFLIVTQRTMSDSDRHVYNKLRQFDFAISESLSLIPTSIYMVWLLQCLMLPATTKLFLVVFYSWI